MKAGRRDAKMKTACPTTKVYLNTQCPKKYDCNIVGAFSLNRFGGNGA